MIVQHNLSAIYGKNRLNANQKKLTSTSEKLSSGYRINRAADNASGLVISEEMRGQIRGLNRASANAVDGISLIATADCAMQEISSILNRSRELCVQAANDTNTSKDRDAIQKELNALNDEIDRIAEHTEFNTIPLLNNGWNQDHRNLRQVIGTSNMTQNGYLSETYASNQIIDMTSNPPGANATKGTSLTKSDTVGTVITSGQNAPTIETSYQNLTDASGNSYNGPLYDAAGNLIGTSQNGQYTTPVAALAAGSPSYPTANIQITSYLSGYIAPSTQNQITPRTDYSYNGTVTLYTSYPPSASNTVSGISNEIVHYSTNDTITYSDVTTDPVRGVHIDFAQLNKPNGFTLHDLYNKGFNSTCATCDNHYSICFTEGTDSALDISSDSIGTHYTLNIGIDSLNAASTGEDLANLVFQTLNDTANLAFTNHYTQYAISGSTLYAFDNRPEMVGQKGSDTYDSSVYNASVPRKPFYIQAGANSGQMIKMTLPWVTVSKMGLTGLSVANSDIATNAIHKVDFAVEYLNEERSRMGAYENRLEHTRSVNDNSSENLQDAESKIRDADMADLMVTFAAFDIIRQAATSLLAQSNKATEGVLQLLQ